MEIKKCEMPKTNDLSFALFQKFIFDVLLGIWISTGGFCLYAAFDFITFSETL
jgi:hypothetical protein